MKTHYFLGIRTPSALEKKRRELALHHHPDLYQDPAHKAAQNEIMAEINAEYDEAKKRFEKTAQVMDYATQPFNKIYEDLVNRRATQNGNLGDFFHQAVKDHMRDSINRAAYNRQREAERAAQDAVINRVRILKKLSELLRKARRETGEPDPLTIKISEPYDGDNYQEVTISGDYLNQFPDAIRGFANIYLWTEKNVLDAIICNVPIIPAGYEALYQNECDRQGFNPYDFFRLD
jgi:curved DNA-binding protein CbpA